MIIVLLPSSTHPITKNVVYSMAFRLRTNFENRLDELKEEFLIPRNYNRKVIESQFTRIRNLPGLDYEERRRNSLEKKEKQKKSIENKPRIIAAIDFNPMLPNIGEILKKHHISMLFKKPELKEVSDLPPIAGLRQPPNSRNLLCRSSLFNISRGNRFQRNIHREAPG